MAEPIDVDVIIVGAGAAGLATAIFLKRFHPSQSVRVLDGARTPGAKILVSGGARCNVTNRVVTEHDFWGGRPPVIRRVLRGFTADAAVEFFSQLGVPLHEEADGKLFPDSNRARDVLSALLREVARLHIELLSSHRVVAVEHVADGFQVTTSQGPFRARRVVLATGGLSLPKSGSDGHGLELARRLGHTIVPTTPALTPLVLDETPGANGAPGASFHRALAGVSHEVELALWIDGRIDTRIRGSLLWTHVGISGPVALNASRHWLRAELDGRPVRLTASFRPGSRYEDEDAHWKAMATSRTQASVRTALRQRVPASLATELLQHLGIDPVRQLAQLTRAERQQLVSALVEWPVPVSGSRGYGVAEATAGGVSLEEIDPATMESRRCPGLYLVGEMLDVDGRIGGFNFQWAWSTAYAAGKAVCRATP